MKIIITEAQLIKLFELEMDKPILNDNFKTWFGNSKVIDNNGNPSVCYHGTPNGGFVEFKPKIGNKGKAKQQADIGSHFSIDKEYAKGYSGNNKNSKIYECYLKIENPLIVNHVIYNNDENFEKYYNIANTLFKNKMPKDFYYDNMGDKHDEIQFIIINRFTVDNIQPAKLYELLTKYGFDGMFHEPYNKTNLQQFNPHPKAYIVLKPNQIKSVDNDGTWDINDNNIYS